MRPRYRPPLNKRYFYTSRKIDKNDMAFLKKKLQVIKLKKKIEEQDNKEKKRQYY